MEISECLHLAHRNSSSSSWMLHKFKWCRIPSMYLLLLIRGNTMDKLITKGKEVEGEGAFGWMALTMMESGKMTRDMVRESSKDMTVTTTKGAGKMI
mmetsp:Transcript_47885/g.35099  ORF Transcript_47885/g.35099 Transcript_47885/m.35099 type:complete len:97 (+) Transcript_47885:387-677(+)